MTDEQIIKALERCKLGNDCDSCEYEPTEYKKGTVGCCCNLMEDALDLINRQKAKINELEERVNSK